MKILPADEPCAVCAGNVVCVVQKGSCRYRADCDTCGEDAGLPGYGESPTLAVAGWEEQQRWYQDVDAPGFEEDEDDEDWLSCD